MFSETAKSNEQFSAGLIAASPAASSYLARHDAAVAWARANRELIASRFLHCLGAEGERVLDVCHNSVETLQCVASSLHHALASILLSSQ